MAITTRQRSRHKFSRKQLHVTPSQYIVGWMQECPISAPGSRTTYLGARLKNALSRRPVHERPTDLSRRPVQERPISASGSRTTYLGAVEERPIAAPDTRTTYLKRDFCFSDFVVAALRDFKIRLLQASDVRLKF